jgi:hypothetical protein
LLQGRGILASEQAFLSHVANHIINELRGINRVRAWFPASWRSGVARVIRTGDIDSTAVHIGPTDGQTPRIRGFPGHKSRRLGFAGNGRLGGGRQD